MSTPNLTQEQQQEIQKYYQYIQQLESFRMQIQQLEVEKREVENAKKEIGSLDADTTLYRSTGSLLYQTSYDGVQSYLEEQGEKIEVRLQSVRSREKKLISAIEEIQKKLQGPLGE